MADSIVANQTPYIDRLRRFQEDLDRDFEYRDILDDLRIPKDDFIWISQGKNAEKIDRLLFYYIYKLKNVVPFLDAIKLPYNWIYNKIVSINVPDQWINDYRRAIRDIPYNKDWNVHRTDLLWQVQKSLKELQRGNYLILFGKPGFGKKWLALDACRDYSVVSRMGFKIYRLNVSKCKTLESILDKLHQFKVLLNVDDLDIKYNPYSGNTKNEIINMKNHLRKVLENKEYRDCLIILTDVQDENIIKAFDLNCKMLITTSHMEKLEFISSDRKQIIDIPKGFTLAESRELFMKALKEPRGDLPEGMTEFISEIHRKSRGHPFLMELIAKSFQNSFHSDADRQKRYENWINKIDEYKIDENIIPITMALDESFKFLDSRQQECYRRLVVFSDNIEVPLEVLAKLWETDENGAEQLIEKLQKYSLIERQMNGTCSLHYVQYTYLKEEVDEVKRQFYHQLILDQYKVEKIYRHRTQLELEFPDDNYFHFYIGYHLIGAKKFDLFDMYLDFGFLEEKIRIAKLPNTLGDLTKFKNEIHRNDKYKMELLENLWTFLPTMEQLLFKSRDVTLLQYALTNEGLVKEEAKRQAAKFYDRVWMNDNNHLKLENQTIELQEGSQPKVVRFVRPNERDDLVCLVSLNDSNILMQDIYSGTDYINKPILYNNDSHRNTITDMQIFRHKAFLVLNDTGKLLVYNLKWNTSRRPSAPTRLNSNEPSADRNPSMIGSQRDLFSCFTIIEHNSNNYNVDLIVGTISGTLKFFKWRTDLHKFEDNKSDLKINFKDLFRIAHINEYAMLINRSGDIKFIKLIDNSALGTSIPLKLENPVTLHQGMCSLLDAPVTICVSTDKVIQITHEKERKYPNTNFIQIQCDDIFMAREEFDENKILSSAVSKDFLYIVLGTAKGIIVIDRIEKKVVSRRNVSEQVISLDIYRYPEEKMYLFISVFEDAGQIINLHSFTRAQEDEMSMLKHETYYLVGDEIFDVKKADDEWKLVAVDNKNFIQYLSSSDDFTMAERAEFKFQVRKICFLNDEEVLVGCTNGEVHLIDGDREHKCVAELTGEITYLENFDGVVVISTNCFYGILDMPERAGKVTKAYRYDNDTLLIIKKDCSIEFVDMLTKEVVAHRRLLREDTTCITQAYCNSLLAISTIKNNNIFIWNIDSVTGEYRMRSIQNQLTQSVTSISISPDKNILAVGCHDGAIEIFDLNELIPIERLESHKRPINNLVFSPWMENDGPLILLSISESINFWNIAHVQNNRNLRRIDPDSTRRRVSQRFKSPLKIVPVSENYLNSSFNGLKLKESQWSNKTGPHDKPELLSCIKFIGKSAKKVVINDDFTRFVTIDNEGNIYNLKLIAQSNQPIVIDYNGNPTNHHE